MADITFSQAERRSFLVPALIAAAVLAAIFGFLIWRIPARAPLLAITRTATLPTHTVYVSGTKLVGVPDPSEDAFFVLTTVRVDNPMKIPIFIKDITGTVTASDSSVLTTSAVEKNDLPNLYVTFPKLKPLASNPLLRETSIPAGGHAEGMVALNFPVSEADWKQRKSASVIVDFYHQGPFTVTVPIRP